MIEERHYKELFEYAVVQMKRRRYATAQAFFVFAYEDFFEKVYKKITGYELEKNPHKRKKDPLDELRKDPWINSNYDTFRKIRKARREIVHHHFISDYYENQRFCGLMEDLMRLIFRDEFKKLDEIIKKINFEKETELALKFEDRLIYKEEDIKKYLSIDREDFNNDYLFEQKIWALKWKVKNFISNLPELENLETGLVSEFGIESEWIWIPIGFHVARGNERVRRPIISVLILRNRIMRVYLDFGTEAIKKRKKYYELLKNDESFRRKLRELCRKREIIFFNVEHYSLFDDFRIEKIISWLDGEDKYKNEIESLIKRETEIIERQRKEGIYERRSNILLFGKEFELEEMGFPVRIEDLAVKILEIVKMLLPFLKMIEGIEG